MPKPLSSQTNTIGTGRPRKAVARAVLIAPAAVEWLADASPNEHTTTASDGHSQSTPRRWARCSAIDKPTALGRCEAMVEVCGMTARSGCPNTLCRPPAIGSSASPISPCSTSRIGVDPGTCWPWPRRSHPSGSAAEPDRSREQPLRPWHCSRGRPNRWCRSRGPPAATRAPRSPGAGWSPAPRRASTTTPTCQTLGRL